MVEMADLSFVNPASDDLPDTEVYGADNGAKVVPFGGTGEGGFYDNRDDMVGGSDTQWTPDWSSRGDNAPVVDAAPWSVGDVLSQSDLAG